MKIENIVMRVMVAIFLLVSVNVFAMQHVAVQTEQVLPNDGDVVQQLHALQERIASLEKIINNLSADNVPKNKKVSEKLKALEKDLQSFKTFWQPAFRERLLEGIVDGIDHADAIQKLEEKCASLHRLYWGEFSIYVVFKDKMAEQSKKIDQQADIIAALEKRLEILEKPSLVARCLACIPLVNRTRKKA